MVEQNVVWGALSLQLSLLPRADRPLLHELVAELEPLVLNLLHLLARKPIILLELQAWQSILKQRVRILEAIADLHVKVILQRLKLGLLLGIHRQSSSGSSLCLVNTLKRRSLIRKNGQRIIRRNRQWMQIWVSHDADEVQLVLGYLGSLCFWLRSLLLIH